MGAELFRAEEWTDRRRDMAKFPIALRNFAETPKRK